MNAVKMSPKVLITDYAWPTLEIEQKVLAEIDAELREGGEDLAEDEMAFTRAGVVFLWINCQTKYLEMCSSLTPQLRASRHADLEIIEGKFSDVIKKIIEFRKIIKFGKMKIDSGR